MAENTEKTENTGAEKTPEPVQETAPATLPETAPDKKPQKQKDGALKASFLSRTFRVGSYSLLAAVIVIAIAVAVVLAVNALPTRYTQYDMSGANLYTLSQETKDLVSGLDQDVDVYLIVTSGNEDAKVQGLLDRYADLSDRLHVSVVDPVANPTFAQQYTDSLRYNNSVIVVCGERSKFVDYTDIYQSDYSTYYMTYDQNDITQTFNGEGALTSAIDYVTNADLPVLYTLTGHGEAELSSSFAQSVSNQNFTTESLSLLTGDKIPDDCDCLLINAPTSDLSADDAAKIQTYIAGGGKLLLLTNYSADESFPNLLSLMSNYGCSLTDGIVIEQDRNHYVGNYLDLLLPDIGSHDITSPISSANMYIAMADAQGITVDSTLPDGVSVTKLLTTSDSAYAATDLGSTEYQEGDEMGPFVLGVAITQGDGQIVWYSTGNLLNDNVNQIVSGANEDLFLNSLNWMCAREDSITIHTKSLSGGTLTMSSQQTAYLGALVCIVIPLAFVAAGVTVIVRRRRRA